MAFSRENTESSRIRAINGFLKKARPALKASGAAIGIDVSGYAVWRTDDMGIGQSLEQMAEYVDYISPMLYPSAFGNGLPRSPSYTPAVSYPYETVYYSLKKALERVEQLPVIVRPWIQYFDDYPWATGKRYGAKEIQQQKKAAYDNDLTSWMMWDPTNKYDKGGLH